MITRYSAKLLNADNDRMRVIGSETEAPLQLVAAIMGSIFRKSCGEIAQMALGAAAVGRPVDEHEVRRAKSLWAAAASFAWKSGQDRSDAIASAPPYDPATTPRAAERTIALRQTRSRCIRS